MFRTREDGMRTTRFRLERGSDDNTSTATLNRQQAVAGDYPHLIGLPNLPKGPLPQQVEDSTDL